MNERIQTGDKYEVIDRKSQYFGNTVIFIERRPQHIEMIDHIGKVIESKEEFYFIFKIEGTETTVEFTLTQLSKT